MQRQGPGRNTLVVLTALAAPAALAFETLLRHLLLPPSFEVLRESLRPLLTPVAWGLAGASVLAGIGGLVVQRRLQERALARLAHDASSGEQSARARMGAFVLGASIAQIPALLATLSYLFGAALPPVIVAVAVVTLVILGQSVTLWRRPRG